MTVKVFLDTKFTNLDNPEIISLGLVSDRGASLYMEYDNFNLQTCSPYTHKNILPQLNPIDNRHSLAYCRQQIHAWFSQFSDVIVFVNKNMDTVVFQECMNTIPTNIVYAYNIMEYIQYISKSLWFNTYPHHYEKCGNTIFNIFLSRLEQYYSINNKLRGHALIDSEAICFAFMEIEQYFSYTVPKILYNDFK